MIKFRQSLQSLDSMIEDIMNKYDHDDWPSFEIEDRTKIRILKQKRFKYVMSKQEKQIMGEWEFFELLIVSTLLVLLVSIQRE